MKEQALKETINEHSLAELKKRHHDLAKMQGTEHSGAAACAAGVDLPDPPRKPKKMVYLSEGVSNAP